MSTNSPPRPDASMDLLNQILTDAFEPGYGRVPRSGSRQLIKRPNVLLTLVVIGFLGGLALATTMRSAPVEADERVELVSRIRQVETELDAKHVQVAKLGRDNAELESEVFGLGRAELDRLQDLSARTGAVGVVGPGLVVTVDDGPDGGKLGSQVVDADLRQIVNSLWESGAEAVAVNGLRISSRTAIRAAGEAITVGYRSVSAPYQVTALGDPNQLEDAFLASPGAAWWNALRTTYGMRFDVKRHDKLRVGSDPALGVNLAKPGTEGEEE